MEVCVDSVESVVNAEKGGAARVELCSNLIEGGTTPSLGILKVIKSQTTIPVFVMIRPRAGDFLYSDLEFEVMKEDISLFKDAGADGIVFGILTKNGEIDTTRCRELLELSRPLPVTFHRAFDMTSDATQALEQLIEMGFDRVLTSGHESSVLEGLPSLKHLVCKAGCRIIVVPGGGITERNLQRILQGCGAEEFHCSARSPVSSLMDYRNSRVFMGAALRPAEFQHKVADENKVRALVTLSQT